MEVKEENIFNNLLCHSCLSVGRYLYKITNEKLLRYYLDALDEIPLSKSKQFVHITVCWECKAILQKSWSFREQAKDSYRILLAYTNENLKECLFSDVSRPPHLQIQQIESININPGENQEQNLLPTVDVKDESNNGLVDLKEDLREGSRRTNDLKEDSLPDAFDDCLSDRLDYGNEEIKTKVKADTWSNKKGDRESKRPAKSKSKRTKKNVKRFEEKKHVKKCLFSDIIVPEAGQHQTHTVSVKDELSNCWEDIKDEFKEDSRSAKYMKEEESLPDGFDSDCLSEAGDNSNDELKTKLETVLCSDKGDDKEIGRNKNKRTKKIVKRIDKKKPKFKNIFQKVVTIELSYDDMLLEREKDSKRDTYVKAEFKCETCLLGFNYKKTYQAHLKSKHSPTLGEYICPICKTIISSVDSFTAHYKRHTRRYECIICHKRTTDLKVMEQHYYSNHEISLKKYTCNICGKISKSHNPGVQCTECEKSFRHRAGLMNHRLAVHEFQNAFPCTVCDKVFRWKTSLKRHLQKHEAKNKSNVPAEPFCTMCNISFSSICSYQRHMRNSLKHVTQDQLRFICDHCNRRFSDKTKLRDHIEEKHLHKTYQCHICSKPSKNRVGLDQHIRNVHMGRPKNKMCHYCGRGFPTKMQLESHIRTHTGERPFICEFCPTTFSQQSNLYKHNRQVHLNIKTKRYPLCKKRKEDESDQTSKVPVLDTQAVIEEPYRPIVLQYSPGREFVL
ncbi:unnamed protein product [Arctia plantaginis]|uniref:C2H2-type domain-containing protein n=1 Tax=Arctia plantaginis TaxID=874455 RepID=A0A8S1B970_ARCPL|nr:unnamed protein product [Arctia plantaginis]